MNDLLITSDPPTYQSQQELDALLTIYRARQPRRVLEIGTFYGGTLRHWLAETAPGAVVVSIDLPPFPMDVARFERWATEAGQDFYAYVGNNRSPAIIEMAQRHAPYDFIFIDADHTYTSVSHDWRVYGALVTPGGIVTLHDINERDGYGVSQLWAEIQAQGYRTETISAGYPGLCGIGVIYA